MLVRNGEKRGEELCDRGFDVDVGGQHGLVAVVQVDVLSDVEVQVGYGAFRRRREGTVDLIGQGERQVL